MTVLKFLFEVSSFVNIALNPENNKPISKKIKAPSGLTFWDSQYVFDICAPSGDTKKILRRKTNLARKSLFFFGASVRCSSGRR